VALFGQVIGWLLVAVHSPKLASHAGAVLLLLTPVGAIILGTIVLDERLTVLRLAGIVLILLAALLVAAQPRTNRSADA
jgi:drug/metabolite transporter (DMT)-like permease